MWYWNFIPYIPVAVYAIYEFYQPPDRQYLFNMLIKDGQQDHSRKWYNNMPQYKLVCNRYYNPYQPAWNQQKFITAVKYPRDNHYVDKNGDWHY